MASETLINKVYNRAIEPINSPVVTAVVNGTAGTTSYEYHITAINETGETSAAVVTVTTGYDTLNSINSITLSWAAIDTARTYKIYGRTNGFIGFMQEVETLTYTDSGIHQPSLLSTPPSENTTGRTTWDAIAFVGEEGRGLQGAEVNEIQSILSRKIEDIANTLFKAGDIVQGSSIAINTDTLKINITEGQIYIKGASRTIPETELNFTGSGTEYIGITVTEVYEDEIDDEILKDPAQLTPGYASRGALRRKIQLGWAIDDASAVNVWKLIDGVLYQIKYVPSYSELEKTLARRTKDVSGQFLVDGFNTIVTEHETRRDKVTLEIQPGKAYVNGYEIVKPSLTKLDADIAKDTLTITGETVSEVLVADPYTDEGYLYQPDSTPVASVASVTAHLKNTLTKSISSNVASSGCEGSNSWNETELDHASIHSVIGVWTDSGKGTPLTEGCSANDWTVIGNKLYTNPALYPGSVYIEYLYNQTMFKGTRVLTSASEDETRAISVDTYNLNYTDIATGDNVRYPITIVDEDEVEYELGTDFTVYDGRYDLPYGTAYITWESGKGPATDKEFTISYYYWDHTIEGDFVCLDSYLDDADPYANYKYNVIEYPDYIDFRGTGTRPSTEDSDIIVTYDSFLEKKAWLTLNDTGEFALNFSKSALSSVMPARPYNVLPRYRIDFDPFSQDIQLYEEFKYNVITQYDLNVMKDRLQNLEHDTGLALLGDSIKSVGLKALHYFIDAFVDVQQTDGNVTTAGMNTNFGVLRLNRNITNKSLNIEKTGESQAGTTTARKGYKKVTKTYTITPEQEQLMWTKDFSQAVNPYSSYGPITKVELTPEVDFWYETDISNVVIQTSIISEISKKIDLWYPHDGSRRSNASVRSQIARLIGVNPDLIPGWVLSRQQRGTFNFNLIIDLNTVTTLRLVDIEYLPYLRQRTVIVNIQGCPPNEDNVGAIFDDKAIDLSLATAADLNAYGYYPFSIFGSAGTNPGTVKADDDGKVTAKFTIPARTLAGLRELEVESPSGDVEGIADYQGLGMLKHFEKTITTQQRKIDTKVKWYKSPVGQSFIVSDDTFLDSIDIWFYRVPSDNDAGIRVVVKNVTESGFPGNQEYGFKFKSKAEIMDEGNFGAEFVLQGDPSETNGRVRFTMEDPGFLPAGEYCFVIEDSAPGYHVFKSVIGKEILGDLAGEAAVGTILNTQAHGGVVFVSANNRSWELLQDSDLMFRINRCEFNTDEQFLYFDSITNATSFSQFIHMGGEVVPAETQLDFEYTMDQVTYYPYKISKADPDSDQYNDPVDMFDMTQQLDLRAVFNTTNSRVSPFFHRDVNFLVLYAYNESDTYQTLEQTSDSFENIKIWIDELLSQGTVTYEISFDSGSTWYDVSTPIKNRVSDLGFTELELGGTVSDVTSETLSTATTYVIRISLANTERYLTPQNRKLRVWVY